MQTKTSQFKIIERDNAFAILHRPTAEYVDHYWTSDEAVNAINRYEYTIQKEGYIKVNHTGNSHYLIED